MGFPFAGSRASLPHAHRDIPVRSATGKRFMRFNMGIEIALTLVPPHRTYGPVTHGIIEPIYCGAWHPGQNICTYCPGRDYVTMNFSMEERHLANVDKIMPLLERIEAMDLPTLKGQTTILDPS